MTRRLYCVLAFTLLFSACLAAQNVFVLPPSSSSAVTVFSADPFSQTAVLNVTSSGIQVLAAPNNKFYIISNVGNGSPTVAAVTQNPDGSFSSVKNVGSFIGALAAQMSPDGRRLVVQSSGGLNLIDTSTDIVIPVSLGGQIQDFAISADSSRAFVVNTSTSFNQIVAIDLKTGTTIATAPVIGTPNNVAVGPTSRVYVSTTGAVLELDPLTIATTRTIQLTGRPGRLSFTPDGKLGLAVNLTTTINGTAAFIFDLNTRSLLASISNSLFTGGAQLSQIVPVSNNRAIAYSSTAQALFDITLNPLSGGPFAFAPAGTVGSFAVSNDIAAGSHAGTQFLFFTSNNTLFRFDLLANQITGQQTLTSTPGNIAFAASPITNGTPAALLTYGDNQSVTLNNATGPLAVRVLDAQGRPLSGVLVTFSVSTSGATLGTTGATTVNAITDNTGLASTTLTSTVVATIPVTVTAGALTATITVNVGGGPSGPSASGCLTIISGQGEVVVPNQSLALSGSPLVVKCTDPSGNPLSGQQITFTIVSGPPTAQINTIVNGIGGTAGTTVTATTDSAGQIQMDFINPQQLFDFSTTTIQATAALDGSVVTFFVTTLNPADQVAVDHVNPPVGSTITIPSGGKRIAAITAEVSTTFNSQTFPVPNVGLYVSSINGPPDLTVKNPSPAMCSGAGGFALSTLVTNQFGDQSSPISCDLIATAPPGRYQLWLHFGGEARVIGPYTLVITAGAPASVSIVSGDRQSGNPGQRLNFPLTVSVADGSGNLLSGVPVSFSVTSGSATLSANSVTTDSQGRATISLTLGNTPGIVQVKAVAGNASQIFTETIVTPATAVQLISGGGQSALVNSPFAAPIVVRVVDASGNGVPGVTVSFIVNGSATVATPQLVTDAQGNASTTVTAGANAGPVSITAAAAGFSTLVTLNVLAPGPSNLVFLNGAGFQRGLAPGAIVAIQGSGLVSAQGVFVPAGIVGPLPTNFQGVSVAFNGVLAPIFSVSNVGGVQQVVVQVPFELTGSPSVNVTVTTAGGGSTTVSSLPLQPLFPGIFETTAFGQRQVVATHDNGSFVSPSNPVRKGENITVFLTGLGQTTPALFTNSPGVPGQRVNAIVTASINNNIGVPIVNDSSGKPLVLSAPGLVGVYTVTVQIPTEAPSGNTPFNVTAFDAANNQFTAQGSFLPIQ